MEKTNRLIVNKTETFVKEMLADAEGGHDWWHIERVRRSSLMIAEKENADLLIVELASLLHDIADSKFHGGNEEIGPETAHTFLKTLSLDEKTIQHIEVDGKEFWLSEAYTPILDKSGMPYKVLNISVDITDSVKNEIS
ncbi:MAG: HD domain-containing protein [Bacteroidales bacterium]|nr:HD domain-containing protein [Bacteroidales bacterium]